MKLIDNRLYLEFPELVECGVSENTIFQAKKRNSPSWNFIADPADRRKVLICFATLKDQYKQMVVTRFGDPYSYIAKQPIKSLVVKDFQAEQFYRSRLVDLKVDNHKLSSYVLQYTTAASWLNMLNKLDDDKQYIKKTLQLSVQTFYDHVIDLIRAEDIVLPTSYRRLTDKMREYKTTGYECLIDWRFGNKLAAKVGKAETGFDPELYEKQVALIRAAASKHQNFDAAQITRIVNLVFDKQGWPVISHGTVANIMKENRHLTTAGARGKRVYDSTMAMQVKRKAPEFPLLYCTLDGWTVELLYQDATGYSNRLVMVVVLDACKKYPVGYAIGDRENAELIRQANRNAILHLRELFGNTYRPNQLQSDHYAIKQMTPFYEAMAKMHTPAAVGNAKSKIIEPYFNYLNKTYFQAFPNWSGHNVNALKSNQPNAEYLDKIKSAFPTKEGVIRQIDAVMHQERLVKLADYRQQWEKKPDSQKLVMSKMDWLGVFGTPHTHTNSITGQGIIATLNGSEVTYDSFDPLFRSLQHLKWQLYFDAADLREVLAISEDGKQRFVLQEKRAIPMDIHSMQAEDYAYLKQIRDFKAARSEEIMQTYVSDGAIVQEVMENTPLALSDFNEARVKLMFTSNGQQKEGLQDAKGLKKAANKQLAVISKKKEAEATAQSTDWNNLQMQYLQSKTDFNQYLD
jgi:hypothetical protein